MGFVSHPVFTLMLVALLGSLIKLDILVGFMGGLFIGSICCLFFRYFSSVVLNSSDVIFWCFALEADAGKRQTGRFDKIYDMIDNHIVVGRPVAGQPAAAQGTVVAAGPAPTVVGATNMMQVQVPAGSGPGSVLQVPAPSGQLMQVTVPAGVNPGQVFQVQLPPAAPQVPAAPQAVVLQEPAAVTNAP